MMVTDYRAIRLASVNLGLLLFFALNPYPRWFLAQGVVQVFFFFTTLYAIVQGNYRLSQDKKKLFWAIIVYIVYFTLPVVHQFKSGYFLYYLVFLQILCFDNHVYLNGYLILKRIIVIVCIASLVVWVLHSIGFHLPYYEMKPEWRTENLKDNYHIYGLCISLYRGANLIGGGLERICGVFAEPGHCGIYLGLMLAIEKFEFDSKENVLMLIVGILTFSTAFYGILSLGLAYRLIGGSQKLADVRNLMIISLVVLPFVMMSNDFYDTAIGRVLNYQQSDNVTVVSMIDSRTSESTQKDFTRFAYGQKLLTGYGSDDKTEMIGTNWRGLVYRYGIIGVVIIAILLLFLTYNDSLKFQGLLVLIALLIISHRSYLMYAPGVYMMLFIANALRNEHVEVISEPEP